MGIDELRVRNEEDVMRLSVSWLGAFQSSVLQTEGAFPLTHDSHCDHKHLSTLRWKTSRSPQNRTTTHRSTRAVGRLQRRLFNLPRVRCPTPALAFILSDQEGRPELIVAR